MNRQEFLDRIGEKEISDAQWVVAHEVYQWHPSIPDVGGKEVIASLYKVGGVGLLSDMLNTAYATRDAEQKVEDARRALQEAQNALAVLTHGYRLNGKG